ncbi:MAG: hypothetical protein WAS07_03990 [Micropruina sp.]
MSSLDSDDPRWITIVEDRDPRTAFVYGPCARDLLAIIGLEPFWTAPHGYLVTTSRVPSLIVVAGLYDVVVREVRVGGRR